MPRRTRVSRSIWRHGKRVVTFFGRNHKRKVDVTPMEYWKGCDCEFCTGFQKGYDKCSKEHEDGSIKYFGKKEAEIRADERGKCLHAIIGGSENGHALYEYERKKEAEIRASAIEEYRSALWTAKLKYPKFNLSGLTAEADIIIKKKED